MEEKQFQRTSREAEEEQKEVRQSIEEKKQIPENRIVRRETKKYEIDMCNGPILPKLCTFFLPLMLSGVLQLLFNAVDVVVVGRFSGNQALAAVGSTTALINMLINFFIGISLGTNVMTARYMAAKRNEELSEIVHTSITVALAAGIGAALMGVFLSKPLLSLMATPESVIGQSILYMRIYFCGMPFFMLYNYGAAILRAVGDTRRPLFFLMIAGCVNVILNLIMVIVFQLGVAGVAIATVVSQLISCILVLRVLMTTEEPYHISLSGLRINKRYLLRIMQIGVPAGLQSTLISFSNTLLQSSVNSLGYIAMAGYTAANNLFGFCYICINSVTQACMSFTSQNLGAGKFRRMDQILVRCLLLEALVGGFMGCFTYLLGHQLLGIYTSDGEVIRRGFEILTVAAVPYFLCGFMDLFPGAMRGMGHSTVPMVLSLVGTVGTRLVWIYGIFPGNRTLGCLFLSYPVSWLVTLLLQVICYYFVHRTVWKMAGNKAAAV